MKMNLQFFAPAPDTIDINLNENKTTQLATKHKYVAKNIAVNVQDVFTYNQPQSITKISSTQQKGLRYNIKGTNAYGDDGYIEFCNGSTYEQQKGTGCGTSLKFYRGSDIGDDAAVDIYDTNNKLAAVFYNGTLDNVKEKTVDLNLAGGNQTVQDGYYQYQESPVNVPGDINYYFSKVIINKPATLVAANIKKDINIAGIVGTLEEGETLPTYNGSLRFASAPTISLSNSTLTITAVDNATSYAIYSNNALLTTITTTSVDLSTLITVAGTYTIYAIAKGTGYVDSEKSNEVSYEISSGYNLTINYSGSFDPDANPHYGNIYIGLNSTTETVTLETVSMGNSHQYTSPNKTVTGETGTDSFTDIKYIYIRCSDATSGDSQATLNGQTLNISSTPLKVDITQASTLDIYIRYSDD